MQRSSMAQFRDEPGQQGGEKVAAARRKVVQGIDDDEYLATVDVLRRMAANLEG
jgi:hypothetical protein